MKNKTYDIFDTISATIFKRDLTLTEAMRICNGMNNKYGGKRYIVIKDEDC